MEILLIALLLILPGLLSIAYDIVKLIVKFSFRKIKTLLQSQYHADAQPTQQSVLTVNYN